MQNREPARIARGPAVADVDADVVAGRDAPAEIGDETVVIGAVASIVALYLRAVAAAKADGPYQGIPRTTPPSTRSAAPLVAEAAGLQK